MKRREQMGRKLEVRMVEVPCRKICLPLDGSKGEAQVEDLMTDNGYVCAEMPCINPQYKVKRTL